MAVNVLEEHRKVPRVGVQTRVEIGVGRPPSSRLTASSINLSEGGLCVRLEETLDLHSRVRLRVFDRASPKPLECAGRVAWVVQRLDLRTTPPFLYDVGFSFVDPPARLRRWASRAGVGVKAAAPRSREAVGPATLNGRSYVPRIERDSAGRPPWHLVIWADGAPCFSRRYPTQREAREAWEQFQRRAGKSSDREVPQ